MPGFGVYHLNNILKKYLKHNRFHGMVLLLFNVPVNNFSVMFGRSHCFLGIYQYFGELKNFLLKETTRLFHDQNCLLLLLSLLVVVVVVLGSFSSFYLCFC